MAGPATPLLAELLRRRAEEAPERAGLIVDGASALTYGDWDRRSSAVAGGLVARGVRPGDRIVLRFDDRHWTDYAVAYAGVHKVGAVAVALPAWANEVELARIVAHCGASGVIGSAGSVSLRVPAGRAAWTCRSPALEEGYDGHDLVAPEPRRALADVHYRSSPLTRPAAAFQRADEVVSELAAREAATPPSPVRTLLHAFPAGSPAGNQALWFALRPGHGPVNTSP